LSQPLRKYRCNYAVREPSPDSVELTSTTAKLRAHLANNANGEPDWTDLLANGRLKTAIRFVDADGVWWVRNTSGALQKMAGKTAADSHPDLQV
jgi:hypothetical protein